MRHFRLLSLVVVWILLVACESPRAMTHRGSVRAPAATGSSQPAGPAAVSIGELRLARIRVAREAVNANVAEWALTGHGQDCVLTFDDRQAWVVGCPGIGAEHGFIPTGEKLDDEMVYWKEGALRFEDKSLPYDQLKMLVGTVFPYPQEGSVLPALVLQDWDTLHHNHPGFTDSPIDEWIGIFVHEAFHARQLWHPRLRGMLARTAGDTTTASNLAEYYASEKIGPAELAALYSSNDAFRASVKKEYELLRGAADDASLDAAKAKHVLQNWLSLYDARAAKMGQALGSEEAAESDAYMTFVEGTARYVEASVRVAPPASADRLLANDPTYRRFIDSRGKPPSQIPGLGGIGSQYFYAIGMYVSFVLDVLDPSWKTHVFDSDGLLFAQVRRSIGKK